MTATISDRLKKFDLYPDDNTGDNTNYISPELSELCSELTKALSKKIAAIPIWFDYSKEEQQDLILNFLNTKLNEQFSEIKLTTGEKERISALFFNSVYGFGPLDFLISQKNITKIFVNSPYDVHIEKNGEIEKSEVIIDEKQFSSLTMRLLEISGKKSSVATFRHKNLLITILREPVCSTKLILKKVEDSNFDFPYFERREILNKEISDFLKKALKLKRRILIASPVQCGKTAFLNSFVNEIEKDKRIILFEEGALINTNNKNVSRFDAEGLTDKEQRDLITSTLYYRPDYILSDINDIGFNIEISDLLGSNSGLVTTLRASSPSEAIIFYTSGLVSKLKCSEKRAKIQFAKDYDYIIQLEKSDEYFVISSINSISSNKAGSPVIEEILSYKSGQYKYNFNKTLIKPDNTETLNEPAVTENKSRPASFSSRFSGIEQES